MFIAPLAAAALTPAERDYVTRQVQFAQQHATAAMQQMRATRPPIVPAAGVLASCYEAAEYLHDALQVDVPADMVEQVRHALAQLELTIDVLDRAHTPGVHPPQLPIDPLAGAIEHLQQLEHQLREGNG